MRHQIIESTIYDRSLIGGVMKDVHAVRVFTAGDKVVHVHTGTNAVDADAWAAVKETDQVKKLLAEGKLADKGAAPDPQVKPGDDAPDAAAAKKADVAPSSKPAPSSGNEPPKA